MTAAWYECDESMTTAVLALLTADSVLGTLGSYAIKTREKLPAITEEDPVVHKNITPYIGVVSVVGNPEGVGHSLAVPLVVGVHIAVRNAVPATARAKASAIALQVVKLLTGLDGLVPSGMVNQVVFMDSAIEKPHVDKSDSTLLRANCSVTFDLWQHD